jgi:GlpG protein
MRLIGHLPAETGARAFSDYLYAQGIDNQIEPERDGRWALWVHAEEQIAHAETLLRRYQENPADPQYAAAAEEARVRRLREQKENESARKRTYDADKLFPRGIRGVGFVTAILIAISVGVSLVSGFGKNLESILWLYISEYDVTGDALARLGGLPEIRHGEIWRLVTPIFVHFDMAHILFNMMGLWVFGTMIERRQSTGVLSALVLVIAVLSNLAQYLVSGPSFGGMSGVVYGLLGYIWLRGKFDLTSGLFLHSSTVTISVLWFFLCLFHVIPNAANTVHTVGFAVGIAWGYLSALLARRRG